MDLQSLQLSFKEAVSQPRYATISAPVDTAAFKAHIKNGHGISPEERIEIYAYAYSARILESLEDDFPECRELISRKGENRFREVLELFLAEYPSRSTSLVDVGRAFPLFLKSLPESKEYPFLYDLARLEWAKVVALYGPIEPKYLDKPFDFAELNRLPAESWPQVRLAIQPSLTLLEAEHAIHEFKPKLARPRVSNRQTFLSVLRSQGEIAVTELTPDQFRTLQLLRKGLNLGQVAEGFAARLEQGEQIPFMEWFLTWARDGVVIAAEI